MTCLCQRREFEMTTATTSNQKPSTTAQKTANGRTMRVIPDKAIQFIQREMERFNDEHQTTFSVQFNDENTLCWISENTTVGGLRRLTEECTHTDNLVAWMSGFHACYKMKQASAIDELCVVKTGSTCHLFIKGNHQFHHVEDPRLPAFSIETAIAVALAITKGKPIQVSIEERQV